MSQTCLFFYVLHNLYFTKLKSRVTFYIVLIVTLEGKECSLNVKSDIFDLWILCLDHATHRLKKKRLISRGFKYSGTRILKGNVTGRIYTAGVSEGSSYRERLQIQFALLKLIVTDISALQCNIVQSQCSANLTYLIRNGKIINH